MKKLFLPLKPATLGVSTLMLGVLTLAAALSLILSLRPTLVHASVSFTGPAAARPAPVVYSIGLPLLVDSAGGRLYGRVSVDGAARHIGVYSARDGKALASFPYPGPFALDPAGRRLFVMTAANQVTVLDAGTGRVLNTVTVAGTPPATPAAQFLTAAPQYDIKSGELLIFTGSTMHVIEPATGRVLRSQPFEVARQGCGTPIPALPVSHTLFDAESRLLYLEFQTYTCTPYVGYTVVAYDVAQRQELSRQGTLPYSGLAASGGFYATSWYRMGVGTIWTGRNGKPATTRAGWSGGSPFGGGPFQLDPKRLQLYQNAEGAIRIFDAFDMSLRSVVPQPVKGTLGAYDPRTDQVYFVDGATIRPFAAAGLRAPAPAPVKVKALPRQPVLAVVPSPNWAKDKTVFALWSEPANATTCYVFNQTGGTLLRSADGGKSWLGGAAGLGKDCALLTSLAVSPDYARDRTLFAGVKGNGTFKSTDGGLSWKPASVSLANMSVTSLALTPALGADLTLFASVADSGLQRSANGGATWQTLKTPANPVVALSPEFDRDGTLAVGGMTQSGPEVHISADQGEHWRLLPVHPSGGIKLLSLAPAFAKWQIIFLADGEGALHRSADGGLTWQNVLNGEYGGAASTLERMQIAYGPNEENREIFLVASGSHTEGDKRLPWGRLYRSTDGGQSWAAVSVGQGVNPSALAISPTFAEDRLLFIGTAEGQILRFTPPVLQ